MFRRLSPVGHRQVTDAYLIALAWHHGGKVATLDRGLMELLDRSESRDQHVTLIETVQSLIETVQSLIETVQSKGRPQPISRIRAGASAITKAGSSSALVVFE